MRWPRAKPISQQALASNYLYLRRNRDAEHLCDRLIRLNPDTPIFKLQKAAAEFFTTAVGVVNNIKIATRVAIQTFLQMNLHYVPQFHLSPTIRGRLGRRLEFRIWLIISQMVDEEPNAIAATYEQQQKSYESHTGDHSTKPRSLGRVDHQFPDQPLQQIFHSVPNARVWS
jgi:hypothetical protein